MTSLSHGTADWFFPVSVANKLAAQHSNIWLVLAIQIYSAKTKYINIAMYITMTIPPRVVMTELTMYIHLPINFYTSIHLVSKYVFCVISLIKKHITKLICYTLEINSQP